MIDFKYIRSFRIGPYAIFDLFGSLLGVAVLAPLLTRIFRKFGLEIPFVSWMLLALPIALIAHVLVGQMTPMTRQFLDTQGNYFIKILIVVLAILGLKYIKRI